MTTTRTAATLSDLDAGLNYFAISSFRDIADGDYIAARFASRAALLPQFLWSSEQAVEKYLKCVLLLHRIKAPDVGHDLERALSKTATVPDFSLTPPTKEFIEYLDTYGRFRYLDVPHWGEGRKIIDLDRAVWELRRFCTKAPEPRQVALIEGTTTRRVRLPGGHLEAVIDGDRKSHARRALLWQNAFFGPRVRRMLRMRGWMRSVNAPLWLRPQLLDEVANYVKIPKEVKTYYQDLAAKRAKKA